MRKDKKEDKQEGQIVEKTMEVAKPEEAKGSELKGDQKLMHTAMGMKDEGNFYFKQKDYKKAISKYVRIHLYLKNILSQFTDDPKANEGNPAMAMLGDKMKTTLNDEEVQACRDLQATAYLNMAICHHMQKNWQKAADNAEKSSKLKPTIKAYYRCGQAYKMMNNYDKAIEFFKLAVKVDVSDPNDIQTELLKCEKLNEAKEKKRV